MNYKYYLVNRPPGIGCQPDGFVERETWMPARPIPEADTWRALGWVEYDHKLSLDEIYRYELFPADRRGCALYKIWLLENKNTEYAESIIREYVNLSDDDFRKVLERHDFYCHKVFLKSVHKILHSFYPIYPFQREPTIGRLDFVRTSICVRLLSYRQQVRGTLVPHTDNTIKTIFCQWAILGSF